MNQNYSEVMDMFYQSTKNDKKEKNYFVEFEGQQIPTIYYIQHMFFAENSRIARANKLAKIALMISIAETLFVIIWFLLNLKL